MSCAVVSKTKEECRQTGSVTVPVMSGGDQYLASVVTEETDCGSLDTPWTLRAPPGQTIHIHLLNFQTAAHPTPDTQHQVPRVCQVWSFLLLRFTFSLLLLFPQFPSFPIFSFLLLARYVPNVAKRSI